jgi:hypothetical protein
MITASASACAAIAAVFVSLRVAITQRRIQEKQLKQDLFDKRYAVFLAVEEFLVHVDQINGSVKPTGDEYRRFRYAMEQAEFLFNADVNSYMKEVDQVARTLHEKCLERDHLALMKQQNTELSAEILKQYTELSLEIVKMLGEIIGPLPEKRKKVFGPYLQLSRISKR